MSSELDAGIFPLSLLKTARSDLYKPNDLGRQAILNDMTSETFLREALAAQLLSRARATPSSAIMTTPQSVAQEAGHLIMPCFGI
ncbi:uncharacterized protein L969DRAFT_94993 [Mixia osmundae IAM 14324]|uniref:Uncharacterized protein n=1 Tax=Mixia osmundae (strain CBS 9802 / IAM 14324 / JCM 22182 / KY 12970) TaxID=764103 RepID=G7E132_MIXOS|nr:uncharacterized protein L969DRAFT_94993 [Mixia osmundae IAM 14324]KEI38822.1 hypothetical protein L969DRAFT_94993 [Mixia osmundae IAM 14324]GAA96542.1 hypothetical protein E5Q_03210 [Mixia osmundae IAM 14324]